MSIFILLILYRFAKCILPKIVIIIAASYYIYFFKLKRSINITTLFSNVVRYDSFVIITIIDDTTKLPNIHTTDITILPNNVRV